MFRCLVRRVLQLVLTFFGATFVICALMVANQDDPPRGDFGRSLTGRGVGDLLAQALPVTARLGLFAAVLMMSLALAAGLTAATRRGGLFDNGTRLVAVVAMAVPTIVLVPALQPIFGIELRRLPVTAGAHPSAGVLLPAIIVGTHVMAAETPASASRSTAASVTVSSG